MNKIYSQALYPIYAPYYKKDHSLLSPAGEIIIDTKSKTIIVEGTKPIFFQHLFNPNSLYLSYLNLKEVERMREKMMENLNSAVEKGNLMLTSEETTDPFKIKSETVFMKGLEQASEEIMMYFSDKNVLSAKVKVKQTFEKETGDIIETSISFIPTKLTSKSIEKDYQDFSLIYLPEDLQLPLSNFDDRYYTDRKMEKVLGKDEFGTYFFSSEVINIDYVKEHIQNTKWNPLFSEHSLIEKLSKGLSLLSPDEFIKIIKDLKKIEEIHNFNIMYLQDFLNLQMKISKEVEKNGYLESKISFTFKKTNPNNPLIFNIEIEK